MKYSKVLAMFAAILVFFAFTKTEPAKKDNVATILETAANNQNLSSFVEVIKAAGLTEMLNGDGPYTVFAPTNEAFDALPEGTEGLLKPENKEELKGTLTYHVIEGKVLSSDLKDGQSVATMEGNEVAISSGDSGTMINGVKIAKADIEASNGVIHIIDKVIMPVDPEVNDSYN